eukprot:GHVT01030879.1.p1 GENE.GHVT01030879.1~~GHVT01030879.1.p1  ORF type:complete len:607 (+),score=76.21 GHVT01030879.1:474-2294(+)
MRVMICQSSQNGYHSILRMLQHVQACAPDVRLAVFPEMCLFQPPQLTHEAELSQHNTAIRMLCAFAKKAEMFIVLGSVLERVADTQAKSTVRSECMVPPSRSPPCGGVLGGGGLELYAAEQRIDKRRATERRGMCFDTAVVIDTTGCLMCRHRLRVAYGATRVSNRSGVATVTTSFGRVAIVPTEDTQDKERDDAQRQALVQEASSRGAELIIAATLRRPTREQCAVGRGTPALKNRAWFTQLSRGMLELRRIARAHNNSIICVDGQLPLGSGSSYLVDANRTITAPTPYAAYWLVDVGLPAAAHAAVPASIALAALTLQQTRCTQADAETNTVEPPSHCSDIRVSRPHVTFWTAVTGAQAPQSVRSKCALPGQLGIGLYPIGNDSDSPLKRHTSLGGAPVFPPEGLDSGLLRSRYTVKLLPLLSAVDDLGDNLPAACASGVAGVFASRRTPLPPSGRMYHGALDLETAPTRGATVCVRTPVEMNVYDIRPSLCLWAAVGASPPPPHRASLDASKSFSPTFLAADAAGGDGQTFTIISITNTPTPVEYLLHMPAIEACTYPPGEGRPIEVKCIQSTNLQDGVSPQTAVNFKQVSSPEGQFNLPTLE